VIRSIVTVKVHCLSIQQSLTGLKHFPFHVEHKLNRCTHTAKFQAPNCLHHMERLTLTEGTFQLHTLMNCADLHTGHSSTVSSNDRGQWQGTALEGQLVCFRIPHQGELLEITFHAKKLASVTNSSCHYITVSYCTIYRDLRTTFKGAQHYAAKFPDKKINYSMQSADSTSPVVMEHSSTLADLWLRQLLLASERVGSALVSVKSRWDLWCTK
jgi:hypothetical protein